MHALRAPTRGAALSRPKCKTVRAANTVLPSPPSSTAALCALMRAAAVARPKTTTIANTASTTANNTAAATALALLPPPPSTAAAVALLEATAPLDRGALATPRDASRVDALARELERLAPATKQPVSELAGRWRLAYISTPAVFRQSPFFDAFVAAVGNRDAAEAIFKFTNELPMARVGSAWQRIELTTTANIGEETATTGRLVSEVDLAVGELPFFRGLAGVVESSVTIDRVDEETSDCHYRLSMTMSQTRVTNSLFSPFGGEAIVAPVERALEAVRGPGAARVVYRVTALVKAAGGSGGSMLRVTRAEGTGLLMVHTREAAEDEDGGAW